MIVGVFVPKLGNRRAGCIKGDDKFLGKWGERGQCGERFIRILKRRNNADIDIAGREKLRKNFGRGKRIVIRIGRQYKSDMFAFLNKLDCGREVHNS